MDSSPEWQCTLKEAYAFAITIAARGAESHGETAEEVRGQHLADTSDAHWKLSAAINNDGAENLGCVKRFASTKAACLRSRPVCTASSKLLATRSRAASLSEPSIRSPLTHEIVYASVRAVDRSCLDRGFKLADLTSAWKMVPFAFRGMCEGPGPWAG